MTRQDWLKLHLDNWARIHFDAGSYVVFGSKGRKIYAQTRHDHDTVQIDIGTAPTPELAATTALTLRLANAR